MMMSDYSLIRNVIGGKVIGFDGESMIVRKGGRDYELRIISHDEIIIRSRDENAELELGNTYRNIVIEYENYPTVDDKMLFKMGAEVGFADIIQDISEDNEGRAEIWKGELVEIRDEDIKKGVKEGNIPPAWVDGYKYALRVAKIIYNSHEAKRGKPSYYPLSIPDFHDRVMEEVDRYLEEEHKKEGEEMEM